MRALSCVAAVVVMGWCAVGVGAHAAGGPNLGNLARATAAVAWQRPSHIWGAGDVAVAQRLDNALMRAALHAGRLIHALRVRTTWGRAGAEVQVVPGQPARAVIAAGVLPAAL